MNFIEIGQNWFFVGGNRYHMDDIGRKAICVINKQMTLHRHGDFGYTPSLVSASNGISKTSCSTSA